MALEAYKASNGALSLRKAAGKHGIAYETLRDRAVKGVVPKEQASEDMQRLSNREEDVLVSWCKQLEAWGWPARISQLRKMATELLQAKLYCTSCPIS